MTTLAAVFALLIAYQVKHFLADFPLQGQFMLRKFHADPRIWVPALAAHAGVHALGTALIASWALYFSVRPHSNLWIWGTIAGLALFDFAVHFAMDRIKASPKMLGRFKALSANEWAVLSHGCPAEQFEQAKRSNTFFWWSLGLDQMVHHLTHYVVIAWLVLR